MTAAPQSPRRLRDLPSPPGLPWFGQALRLDRARLHQQLEAWRDRYGDAYRIRLGPRQFVVVADPQAIAAALRDRPAGLGRTDRIVSVAREAGFEGVFAANGDAWRRQRPMVMAGFDPRRTRSYFPTLVKVTDRFAARWERAAAAAAPIDLQADLMRYTVDVISGLAFGVDINTLEQDDDVIQRHLDQIFPALFRRVLAPLPTWRVFRMPADRRVDVHLAALRQAVQGFIAQARARLAADPALRAQPGNLIEAMLVARDTPGSGLRDDDVSGNVLTALLAGEDTTANTLAWMIHLLWRNPPALARARAEVRAALGDERLPLRLELLAGLRFVEACAHETMRLKPVAPLLAQQAQKDVVIAGIAVPRGTLLMFLMRAGPLDPRHFPDPQRFEPARWLDGGHAASGSGARVAMPFGAGPRICPGRYLALLEIKMVMAMLLGRFDIVSVSAPGGGAAAEHLAFTMAPVGLQMHVQPRAEAAQGGR